MHTIQVSHVAKSFGKTQAVADVSFDVERGEIFGLLGPNGAGKTTTIRLMLDIFKPEHGTVSILDGPMTQEKKERIGYMPEDRGLYQDAPLGGNVIVRSLDGSREFPSGGPTFGIIMPLLISIAFLILLLMSSGYLMQAVADEKENRTMEVLMTSVSPTQFIGGKVLGIVAISFTQFVAWTAVAVLAIIIARSAGIAWFQNLDLDWGTIWTTVAVAIPAYVLASALMTAVGATVTSAQEGQSMGTLFFMLHIIPVYVAGLVIVKAPSSSLPTVLSLLPFTALMTISLRNIFTVVPLWQVAASAAVQTVCAVGALWLAGRAFRLGMLRYGQRLNWRELMKERSQ